MGGLECMILSDPKSRAYEFSKKVFEKIQKKDGQRFSYGRIESKKFPDGEIKVRILDNVRRMQCYFIHDSSKNPSDWWVELLLVNDALKRASAQEINDVLPYMLYSRQDRIDQSRVPISAKCLADCISINARGIITTDLHSGQLQGFTNLPYDNLRSFPTMVGHLKDNYKEMLKNCVIVSPDAGGTHRARAFAKRLYAGLALIDKRRIGPGQTVSEHVIGDVNGKDAILLDDMIDTGGSMIEGAKALRKCGAKKVYACCTHAVFSRDAQSKLVEHFDKVIITDTIDREIKSDKIEVISLAGLYSEAIYSASKPGGSLSRLYEDATPSTSENIAPKEAAVPSQVPSPAN